MVLNIKPIYEGLVECEEFDFDISPERLSEIKGHSFKRFHVSGKVYNRAGVAVLKMKVDFVLSANCDRCLKPIEKSFSADSRYILVRGLNEDNDSDEYIVTENDCLELDDHAVWDGLLQIPTKLLCSEDCKGLCIHCGADLNEGLCGCENRDRQD